ncbi:MAG: helix-turn-helix domain-containing protein [Pseudonocardiaceae bacterium]
MTVRSPVSAPRQRLRAELRREREQANLTQKEVATAMDWSPSKMLRIETGTVGISVVDLRALLTFYQTAQQRAQELIALVRVAPTRTTSDSGGEH